MAAEEPAYRPVAQDELSALAGTSRTFSGMLFSPATSHWREVDFTEKPVRALPVPRAGDPQRQIFQGSAFKNCRFEPTRFASCKLANTRFDGCALFDLRQKKGCTFAFCDIQAAEAIQCNFATSSFERCDLYNVRAVECSFRGARFHHSTFSKALSKRSALTKATFDKCNLSFADLSGLQLQSCEFLSCKLSEASFIDTDLSNATMLACALDRAEWDRAKLREADLRGSQISGLNLAVLADYAGLTISESEQSEILTQLGVKVRPEDPEVPPVSHDSGQRPAGLFDRRKGPGAGRAFTARRTCRSRGSPQTEPRPSPSGRRFDCRAAPRSSRMLETPRGRNRRNGIEVDREESVLPATAEIRRYLQQHVAPQADHIGGQARLGLIGLPRGLLGHAGGSVRSAGRECVRRCSNVARSIDEFIEAVSMASAPASPGCCRGRSPQTNGH